MSCEGYEHGSKVVLERRLGKLPVGLIGTVMQIDREKHKVAVLFEGVGLVTGLDPHAFSEIEEERDEREQDRYFESEGEF